MPKRSEENRFHNKLVMLKKELSAEVEFQEKDSLKKSQRDFSGDLSGYSIHMADVGTDNYNRSFVLDLVSSEFEVLHEIDSALERIERDEFGLCERCGTKIGRSRLEAIPYARLCIGCKELEEQENP